MPPIAIAAGIGAIGSIAGGVLGGGAAENAASAQSQAAEQAAQLQYQESQNALNFQKQVYGTEQQQQAPFLSAGQQAIGALSQGVESGALTRPYGPAFTAPTAAQAAATPGYQFALQQGEQALERSAAASGNLLTGGTLKDITQYAQGLADTNYQNVYNNALQTYGTNFNVYEANQANKFNRLASLAGVGQTATQQLGQEGQSAANINATTNLTAGAQIGNQINNAAAARASGYVGAANAYGGAANNIAQYASLIPLLNQNGGGINPNDLPAGSTILNAGFNPYG